MSSQEKVELLQELSFGWEKGLDLSVVASISGSLSIVMIVTDKD